MNTYDVLAYFEYAGQKHAPGDTIELTPEQHAELRPLGVVSAEPPA